MFVTGITSTAENDTLTSVLEDSLSVEAEYNCTSVVHGFEFLSDSATVSGDRDTTFELYRWWRSCMLKF